MPPPTYHAFMNANFLRSGRIIYQPSCASRRQCQSLRVLTRRISDEQVATSLLAKELGRCRDGRYADASLEKFEIYRRYLGEWHGREDSTYDEFCDFLYRSPVQTLEFEYRDASARLLRQLESVTVHRNHSAAYTSILIPANAIEAWGLSVRLGDSMGDAKRHPVLLPGLLGEPMRRDALQGVVSSARTSWHRWRVANACRDCTRASWPLTRYNRSQ